MPPAVDAVLADAVLVLVTCDDHLVRQVDDQWVCIRPRHSDQPCSTALIATTRPVTGTPV